MVEIKRNADVSLPQISAEARSNGETLAGVCGEIVGETLHIDDFFGEKMLFDGVCRALLNIAEHSGAVGCVFGEKIDRRLLASAKLQEEIRSIAAFFDKKCCGCCDECSGCKT